MQTSMEELDGRSILVIDNDESIVDLIADALRACHARVITAGIGHGAEEVMGKGDVDLIFMDLNEKHGDRDLLDYIRIRYPSMVNRIVLMTGDWRRNMTQRRVAEEGLPVLLKPFELRSLRSLARSIIAEEWAGMVLPAA